jgi:hypothetical protein
MLSAPIGNTFTLKHVVTDAAGVPTDAASVTFFVEPRDGGGVRATGSATRHTGTGAYEFDFDSSVSVGGIHEGRVETTNPKSAAQIEFYVIPSNTA